ncbi:MAG: alcohol dehydrogenase catalytic domain-containing protein [Anaerolineaceae bacterium]|nr:alcohol dehydrogenase catalytic domain-containing protein [Anaerolineaceae bacterium]
MMKAAIYDGTNIIKLEERPIPKIGPDEALLKVNACGVCGTDLRILQYGHNRIPKGETRILGHEFSGEIVSVGSNVRWPRPGMKVVVAPNMGCGICQECVTGHTNLCKDYISYGVALDGAFAEYMRILPQSIWQGNICHFDDKLSFAEAAFTEPLSCALHGYEACFPKLLDHVLIVGMGPLGLAHLQIARFMGAKTVIMSDHHNERIPLALEFGADMAINSYDTNLKQVVSDVTHGHGVDIAIVAAPSPSAQKEAVENLAMHGRLNFFGGLPKDNCLTTIDANLLHYRELILTGTTGQTIDDFRKSLELIQIGKVQPQPLITNRFLLEDIVEAIDFARSKKGLKTMVFPHGMER